MRFRRNPLFPRQVEAEAPFRAGLMVVAETVAAEARARAHRIMPKGKGDNIKVEADAGDVVVVNHDYGSHLDEFGSINNEAYAPLRGGARAAGAHLKETGK